MVHYMVLYIAQAAASSFDLVLAGTSEAVLMIEGFADFLPEEQVRHSHRASHRALDRALHDALLPAG